MNFLDNLLSIYLDAAPWLLLGFVTAGLIKVWIPDGALNRWLGGEGIWPITKAALIGAPLPLCSCGVLPAATELHRSGASRGSTVSFLIATPETGVDSIALSYVLLGPVMAVIRPIAAVLSAIFTGILITFAPKQVKKTAEVSSSSDVTAKDEGGCCSSGSCSMEVKSEGVLSRTASGMRYALVEMVEDLLLWLSLGLILAALISTLVPPMVMAEWGSGLPAMLMMILVGIPMYICATASTPVATALLFAGISPGTVLVFLLAGPATNIATIGVLRQEMGKGVVLLYLAGISFSAIILGILTDWFVEAQALDIQGQISDATEWMPEWISLLSGLVLFMASLNVLLRKVSTFRAARSVA